MYLAECHAMRIFLHQLRVDPRVGNRCLRIHNSIHAAHADANNTEQHLPLTN